MSYESAPHYNESANGPSVINIQRYGFRQLDGSTEPVAAKIIGVIDTDHAADQTGLSQFIRQVLEPGDRVFVEASTKAYGLADVDAADTWENSSLYALATLIMGRAAIVHRQYKAAIQTPKAPEPQTAAERDAVRADMARTLRLRKVVGKLERLITNVVIEGRNSVLLDKVTAAAEETAGRVFFIAGEGHITPRMKAMLQNSQHTYAFVTPIAAQVVSTEAVESYISGYAEADRGKYKREWLAGRNTIANNDQSGSLPKDQGE